MTPEEHQKYQARLWIFYAILGVILLTLVGGLGFRQIIESSAYAEKEKRQNQRRILTPGPRGNMFDRDGRLVVANRPQFSAVVHLSDESIRRAFRAEYLALVRDHRERGEKFRSRSLEIQARANVIQSYLDNINLMLGRDDKVEARSLSRHFETNTYLPYKIIDDLSREEFAILLESEPINSAVDVYVSSVRHYPYESAAAHTLGYVSSSLLEPREGLPGSDLRTFQSKGIFGRNGIEKFYDTELQGSMGTEIWTIDVNGYKFSDPIQRIFPRKGNDLQLSLDMDLQMVAEEQFDRYESEGALVAIDLNTVEILAMVSKPDFNLNDTSPSFSTRAFKEIEEKGAWENKAIRRPYPPGSPFKLVTAIAALKAGMIDENTVFNCQNQMMVSGTKFVCHSGNHHGEVSLRDAIKKSCNIYFYNAALKTGVDLISQEAIFLGLDKPTGINLPNETRHMIVPSKEYKKERHNASWYPGDTANMAIGQGFLLTTPMQMALLTGSIARNEVITQPSILKQSPKELVMRPAPRPLGLPPSLHKAVVEGMEKVVQDSDGTGRFANLRDVDGARIAGKTGTAQVRRKGGTIEHAWFVAFAPANDPKIALALIVEGKNLNEGHGGGTNAAPIAHYVLRKYFEKRPENLRPETPTIANVALP